MIVFRNPGLIDPLAITTMGVNAKVGDNPIGQFGTGLKYAIAIILRNGGSITICRGTERLVFGVIEHTIRDKPFGIVTMNGQPLGFTTQVGPHWETWMAFREIYCNCTDESGKITAVDDDLAIAPAEGETLVQVCGADFDKHYRSRGQFVLATEALVTLPRVEVHPDRSALIYYRGIRVGKIERPALYTYNLIGYQSLTEDRTLAYESLIPGMLAKAWTQCQNVGLVESVLTAESGVLESNLPWSKDDGVPSEAFMSVSAELVRQNKLRGNALMLFRHNEERVSTYSSALTVKPSTVQREIIAQARDRLLKVGVDTAELGITLRTRLPGSMLVMSNRQTPEIVVHEKILEHGDLHLAKALLCAIAYRLGGAAEDRLAELVLTGEMKAVDPMAYESDFGGARHERDTSPEVEF